MTDSSSRALRFAHRCLVASAFAAVIVAPLQAAGAVMPPSPHAASAGGIGIRLVDIPVDTHGDDRALLYIVDHLAPGTSIHRRIEVSNTTDSSAHVALYAAAASIDHDAFLVADAHTPNELSTWTSVSPSTVNVSAGAQALATVRIAVPDDAAPGEQYAVVWAEVRSSPHGTDAVVQVNRVGIRLYLSVGRGNPPAEDFTVDWLTATRSPAGLPMVLATVHNTGGRAIDMSGTLELTGGPGGLSAGPFPASLGTTLAPGDTGTVTIALDEQIPVGPWDAQIDLKSGLLDRTERATITFPTTGAVTVSTHHGLPVWVVVVGIAFALLAVAVLSLVRRRRTGGAAKPVRVRPTTA